MSANLKAESSRDQAARLSKGATCSLNRGSTARNRPRGCRLIDRVFQEEIESGTMISAVVRSRMPSTNLDASTTSGVYVISHAYMSWTNNASTSLSLRPPS